MKYLLITILMCPLMAMGQQLVTDENGNPIIREEGFTPPQEEESSLSDENLDDTGNFESVQNGGRENANSASNQAGATQMVGMIMGGALVAACFSSTPPNYALCAMGAAAFATSAISGASKGHSGNFESALLPEGGTGEGFNQNGENTTDPLVSEAQAQLAQLEEQGVVMNADGSVTVPSGQTLSQSDLSSPAGMQAKGFSAAQAQSAFKGLESARKKAADEAGQAGRAIASVSEGSLKGGYAGGAGELPPLIIDEEVGGAFGAARKKKKDRMPADEAARLSKNFNGTPIGVSIADLFLIVKKKYEEKDSKREFFNKEY